MYVWRHEGRGQEFVEVLWEATELQGNLQALNAQGGKCGSPFIVGQHLH